MTDPKTAFDKALSKLPIVAILRGLDPADADWVGDTLVNEGIRIIEVPLNSPSPLKSIETLAHRLRETALIGAGTVTTAEQVADVAQAGGQLVVSPNTDSNVIRASVDHGLMSCPGSLSPTEAFDALKAGADALKIFPANVIGPPGIKALMAVLPVGTRVLAVGGIEDGNMTAYWRAGVQGFGIGSALYQKGMGRNEVARRAKACATAAKAFIKDGG
ncbi:MAG: 2-dehydro-3-deoxy-6-phosphogalactonate aldolase [Pseudomonadota bacterium]